MRWTLSVKITSGIAAILIAAIGISVTLNVIFVRNQMITDSRHYAIHLSEIAEAGLENAMVVKDPEKIKSIMTAIGSRGDIVDVAIFNKRGEVKYSITPGDVGRTFSKSDPMCITCHAGKLSDQAQTVILPSKQGARILKVVRPIINQPRCQGCHQERVLGMLMVDLSLAEVDQQATAVMGQQIRQSLVTVVIIIVALIGFMYLIVTRPLAHFVRTTQAIDNGDLDKRVNLPRNDEIGELGASFNRMVDSMAARTQELERLNEIAATEITEREKAEEALREQTAIAQTFMDALPCVALLLKPRTREIVALNKMAREAGARLGSTCFESWPKFDKACHFCLAPEVWKNGKPQILEIDAIGTFWEAHWVPVSEDIYLHYALDITPRKRAEEEKQSLQERLQRAEKMEALGTLAGGVAHDLNNVLGIVVGYAGMLLDDVDETSPIHSDLMNILSGGERAAAIVQDLLTLARRGVSNRKVLNLSRMVADYRNSPEFETLSSYHPSVQIKIDLEPNILNISGSPVHIGKTLFNLASNGSEAMPNGGVLTIRTTNQYIDKPVQGYDDVREGEYVVLSVSDTGEGIPAADLKRIFEPFYTKKVMGRSGTGLGLAVVWGTVKDHNGYINVQSEEGKGSTFTLYFPVTRDEITADQAAVPVSEYMGRGESILIVDDVKGQRDLAAKMLGKLNYSVASVSSGEEAVAYLKGRQIDLMILDMIMDPGMDGLDTYKQVIEIHPKQKAIIVSGFSESDRVTAAQALGAGAYVKKPYVPEIIGLAVKKELDRSA